MANMVVGVVDKPVAAQRVIDDLIGNCRCDRSDIGLMARGSLGDTAKTVQRAGEVAAGSAAAAEAVLAGMFGAIGGAVSRLVPGLGPLSAVGSLAATLLGAGIGTAAGLASALVDIGLPKNEASYYADAVQRGRILISVDAKTTNMAQCAEQVMRKHGALASDARATH